MAVVLPGYQSLIENQVYGREKETEVAGKRQNALEIVLPKTYRLPTEDQIIEYIQRKAAEVARDKASKGTELFPRDKLIKPVLESVPDEWLRCFADGDKELIGIIRDYVRGKAINEGKTPDQYLQAKYGLLPAEARGMLKSAQEYDEAFAEDKITRHGYGEKWRFMLLLDNDRLPPKSEIDVLVKHNTHTKTLRIVGNDTYSAEAVELLDGFYKSLSSPEKVRELKDISGRLLEEGAARPVLDLRRLSDTIGAGMAIASSLKDLLKGLADSAAAPEKKAFPKAESVN